MAGPLDVREAVPPKGCLLGDIERVVDGHLRGLAKWLDLEAGSRPLQCGPRAACGPGGLVPGDRVHVWSNSTHRWITDGLVREVLSTELKVHNQVLPPGSVRVVFKGGEAMKWVLPPQCKEILRKVDHYRDCQAFRELPTPQKVRPAAEAVAMTARPPKAATEATTGPAAEEPEGVALATLRALEQRCQAERRHFEDPEFPPSQLHGKVKRWCRPHEITAQAGKPLGGLAWEIFGLAAIQDWQLFRGAPRAEDVQQGELGDCWLISALSALAEFQGGCYVRALLPGQERMSPCGAYLVRLCLGGRWRSVLVDDRLPCMEGRESSFYTQLAYCETHRQQLWASIIEKGLAKACGSYGALQKGQAREALSILTGWPCTMVCFDRPDFDAGILWATLLSAKQAGFLMACGTYRVRSPSLQPYHIYALLDLFDVTVGAGENVKILKIRNPHAKSKWEGAWADGSDRWTPELRQQLGCPEGGTPGVFFISFGDFLKNFAHCTICKIRSNEWHEVRRPVRLPSGARHPTVGLALSCGTEAAECCVSLSQPEERLIRGRKGPHVHGNVLPLAAMGFALLDTSGPRPAGEEGFPVVGLARLRQRETASIDLWLKANCSYLLVPFSEHAGVHIEATVACFSSRPLAVAEERPGPEAVAAVRKALQAQYRHVGPRNLIQPFYAM